MSDDNNIKNYSAADIEKYHTGKMTAREMHALEKAALDDSFLADALEGYATKEAASITKDIDFLKEKINERVNKEKVVAIPVNKPVISWMRVAAMILLTAGFGWMVYEFAFKKSSEEVASVNDKQVNQDSNHLLNNSPAESEKDVALSQPNENAIKKEKSQAFVTDNHLADTISNQDNVNNKVAASSKPKLIPAPEEKNVPPVIEKDAGRKANADVVIQKSATSENKDGIADSEYKNSNVAGVRRQAATLQNAKQFRGQVLDVNLNPLPFANITNTRDNIGTYTDAKGNFTLISPDSILNVQIRSLGFENENTQLRNDLVRNNIILQQDKQNLNEIVVSNKRLNTNRAKEARIVVEEPEPADGWYNYDTYISNNLKIPDNSKADKISGEVDLSFEVNKNGAPVNIKIEKSLCSACDEEAVRLIKEGPKWKKKGKKSRVKVTVPF